MSTYQLGQWVIVKGLVFTAYDESRNGTPRELEGEKLAHEPEAITGRGYTAKKCLYREAIRPGRFLVVGHARLAHKCRLKTRMAQKLIARLVAKGDKEAPIKSSDHAMDALRYACYDPKPASPISVVVTAPVEDLLQIQEPEWMNAATI